MPIKKRNVVVPLALIILTFSIIICLIPNQTRSTTTTKMYIKPDNGLVYYLRPNSTNPDGRIPHNATVTVRFTQLINDTKWALATYNQQDVWVKSIQLSETKQTIDPNRQVIRELIISDTGKKHTVKFKKTPKFNYVKQYTRPYPTASKTELKLHKNQAFRVMKIRETKGGIWVYGEAKNKRGWVQGKYIENLKKSLPH